jgi:aminoglycoside phosphotransferase family enzyme/predicted kinase
MVAHPTTRVDEQVRLIRLLTDPTLHGPWCANVRVVETHISYVLLTGRYAYKIKKPVDLGFLDFTTLDARRFYCDRELTLNRRHAPTIYLDVVAITGTVDHPCIGGDGPALEYAVRMREFPQDALLTQVLARGELTASHVDQLAATVADFHGSAVAADASSDFGSATEVLDLAIENFTEIVPLLHDASDLRDIAALRQWTEQEHARRAALFTDRQRGGFVRDCHGDLHLGNIALIDGQVTIFDCIEFNDHMRWSDVMADVAFVVMDLHDRGRPDLASRFLSAYLELTGDYEGVAVLRFYVVFRAMVRAKVACMRARQTNDAAARIGQIAEYRQYLKLATVCSRSSAPGIVITHGFSGSGKTKHSECLVERAGAVRIRTDVERKRRHGLPPGSRSGSALNTGLYAAAETDRTYLAVARFTRAVAGAGYPVVVDATFLQRHRREQFRTLSEELGVPFVIVDLVAPVETLRARVQKRDRLAHDASEADVHILEDQLRTAEPLTPEEVALAVTINTEASLTQSPQPVSWQPVLDRLQAGNATRH